MGQGIDPARQAALGTWVATRLRAPEAKLMPLTGDAGFRSYYRVSAGGTPYVVMDAGRDLVSCTPFLAVRELLAAAGLNVPAIAAQDLERGWLILSDLGRESYLEVLLAAQAAEDAKRADALYGDAIDALITLQRSPCPATLAAYDEALLRRELELFPEWYLGRHRGITVDDELRSCLDALFSLLIERALAQPRVLVHRDYMPRNLMVSSPNPGVLDFQDAVCGPISYDPVCLFKDAFISWPQAQVDAWLHLYWERGRGAGLPLPASWEMFRDDCDWMGAQRHLKVIGIFARICHRDGKPHYLSDVPRFFAYLDAVAARQSALSPLRELLARLPREGAA